MILRLTLNLLLVSVLVTVAAGCGNTSADQRFASADPCLRATAASSFSTCDDQLSAERLIRLLEDDDEGVRFYASAALYRRSGERFGYVAQGRPDERAAAIRKAIVWHNEKYPQCADNLDDLVEKLDKRYAVTNPGQ